MAETTPSSKRHRNVLLITVDELRGDCLGYAGNPDVRTPHLDKLAARGAAFEKHFAPFPKCVPSRVAMITGRQPHTDGLRTVMEANHIPAGRPNLVEFLRSAGYETAVLGLNHVWTQDAFYGTGEHTNSKGAGVVDFTSFTQGPLAELATRERVYPAGNARSTVEYPIAQNLNHFGLKEGIQRTFSDDNRADQAILYLKELRDPAKPFYLQLNLSCPHPPYQIHDPWYSMYDPNSLTPFPHDLPRNAALPLRAQRQWRLGNDVPPAILREIQAIYYGMVSYVDDLVGKVLQTLESLNLEDETLVIFCSDHGDYAGQHGLNEKWDGSLQDCLLHVPFIIAGPNIEAGKRVTTMSEIIDTPATVLDYLNLERPDDWNWHGQSLLPSLKDAPGRPAVFATGGHEAPMRARFNARVWDDKDDVRTKATEGKQLTYARCPDAMARCKMVRTDEWKLIVRETGDNELFNLRGDPFEMNNLFGDPGHEAVILHLQTLLIDWMLRTDPDLPFIPQVGG